MHVECAPPFWIRGGCGCKEKKRNREACVKKMLKCRIWTGNALKTGKMTRKKKWRSTIFDHLPPCGFGDYINVWL